MQDTPLPEIFDARDEPSGLDNDNLLLRLSLLAALMGDSRPRATLRDAITRIEHLTTEVAALRAELAVPVGEPAGPQSRRSAPAAIKLRFEAQ